jgi:two-component system sensor histidine kinase CreC
VGERLQARGVAVVVEGGPAPVEGDAFLLRQSLVNLLDNAADFAPAGTALEVAIRRDDAHWVVTVADRGPGVPDYALDRAFERFYSLPRPGGGSRSSGLGLCFVAEAATLHGGSAALANREGGGAVASLRLPA